MLSQCYNVAKIKGEPGCFGGNFKEYDSIADSITDLVNYISNNFYTKEMQVPSKMYVEYGKNSTWAYKVNKIMETIKKSK